MRAQLMLSYVIESHFHDLSKKSHYHFTKECNKNLEWTDYCLLGKMHTDT